MGRLQEQSSTLDSTGFALAAARGPGPTPDQAATPGMAPRYRVGTEQYLPSNAQIRFRCFLSPAVNAGSPCTW